MWPPVAPYGLKLSRTGNTFTSYISPDGHNLDTNRFNDRFHVEQCIHRSGRVVARYYEIEHSKF